MARTPTTEQDVDAARAAYESTIEMGEDAYSISLAEEPGVSGASVDYVFVGVGDFYTGNYGSPTINIETGAGAPFDTTLVARMNDGEGVGWVGMLPNSWNTYTLHYHWANSGTGAGNVEWQCYWYEHGDGDLVKNGTAHGEVKVVDASTTAYELKVSEITTTPVSHGVGEAFPQMVRCMFNRHSTSTLVGDAILYGVEFRRAS